MSATSMISIFSTMAAKSMEGRSRDTCRDTPQVAPAEPNPPSHKHGSGLGLNVKLAKHLLPLSPPPFLSPLVYAYLSLLPSPSPPPLLLGGIPLR